MTSPQTELRGASILHVRKTDDARREIVGVATRAELDRVGDVVESAGVRFHNPTPLLLHHDHSKPVGQVWFTPGDGEIRFRAMLPKIAEPGPLRDRVEEAYQSVIHGLIAAVSIGFRVLPDGAKPLPSGGWRYVKTELLELSLVTCPALPSARITGVKSVDDALNEHLSRVAPPAEIPNDGLNEQEREDLLIARFKREMGARASKPVTELTLRVVMEAMIQQYKRLKSQDKMIAGAIVQIDDRLKALEGR